MDQKKITELENRIILLEGTVVKLDRLVYKLFKRLRVPADTHASQTPSEKA